MKGPQVKVDFYLKDKKIVGVNLSESIHQGTAWNIIADHPDDALEHSIRTWMQDYCSVKQSKLAFPLHYDHFPPFTKNVWAYLLTIPFGKSVSYGELAVAIGQPKGARAVGNACGRNPLPLLIPCHRVLRNRSQLGGFSAGLSIKQKLLAHEDIF